MDLTPLFDTVAADTGAASTALHGSRCPDCGASTLPARRVCAAVGAHAADGEIYGVLREVHGSSGPRPGLG